jgi:hypothetical protein
MKTAIILVGRHEVTNKRYQGLVAMFLESGWERVLLYEPDWRQVTIKKLVTDFLQFVPENSQPLTLLGFSLGAMIAFVASAGLKIDNLILCSPSGYFKEYANLLSTDDLAWARGHLKDFENYSATELVSKSQVKNGHIIAGQIELEEWSDFEQWVTDLRAKSGWTFSELPNVGHEIESPNYQDAIKALINKL